MRNHYTKSPASRVCTAVSSINVSIHITAPVLRGIEKLSSIFRRIDAASTIPPMNVAMPPMTAYCQGACVNAHITPTTTHAESQNALVPSKLLSKNRRLPNFRPISADEMSETINTANAVIAIIFGNRRIQRIAESSTYVAPLSKMRFSASSCERIMPPKILRTSRSKGGIQCRARSIVSTGKKIANSSHNAVSRLMKA